MIEMILLFKIVILVFCVFVSVQVENWVMLWYMYFVGLVKFSVGLMWYMLFQIWRYMLVGLYFFIWVLVWLFIRVFGGRYCEGLVYLWVRQICLLWRILLLLIMMRRGGRLLRVGCMIGLIRGWVRRLLVVQIWCYGQCVVQIFKRLRNIFEFVF